MSNNIDEDIQSDINEDLHANENIEAIEPTIITPNLDIPITNDEKLEYINEKKNSFKNLNNKVNKDNNEKKLKKGLNTATGSFYIINTIMGAGTLGIAIVFKNFGIFFCLFSMIALAYLGNLMVIMLLDASKISKKYSYASLSDLIYGFMGSLFIKFVIIINAFGTSCAYFKIIGEVFNSIVKLFLSKSTELNRLLNNQNIVALNNGTNIISIKNITAAEIQTFNNLDNNFFYNNWHYWFYILIVSVPVGYLVFKEKVGALKYATFAGMISIVSFFIFLLMIYIYKLIYYKSTLPILSFKMFFPDSSLLEIISVAPNILLAFSFQHNVFPIYKALKKKTADNMIKISGIGVYFVFILYSAIGLIIFLMYGNNVTSDSLELLLKDMHYYYITNDVYLFIIILLTCLSFVLIALISVPIFFIALRANLFDVIKSFKKRKYYNKSIREISQNKIKGAVKFKDGDFTSSRFSKIESDAKNKYKINESKEEYEKNKHSDINIENKQPNKNPKLISKIRENNNVKENIVNQDETIKSNNTNLTVSTDKIQELNLSNKEKYISIGAVYILIIIVTILVDSLGTVRSIIIYSLLF